MQTITNQVLNAKVSHNPRMALLERNIGEGILRSSAIPLAQCAKTSRSQRCNMLSVKGTISEPFFFLSLGD